MNVLCALFGHDFRSDWGRVYCLHCGKVLGR
jgi:hypothetical protein